MKKFFIMGACLAMSLCAVAQKTTADQAKKLAGKLDKIQEARELVKQSIAENGTNDAYPYYVGGKVEFDAFKAADLKRSTNPNDPAVNLEDMGNQLINGYNYYLQAFPLDSVPNEKGVIKPKYSKEMASTISGHHNQYFQFGGEFYNNKKFYPEAYNAFMIFGDIPGQPWADKSLKAVPDTTLALSYYYAGISAYSDKKLEDAIKALKKARLHGITEPTSLVYEIACWQNLALQDSTLENRATAEIEQVARDGFNRFGIENHLFLTNLANTLVQQKRMEEAVQLIDSQLAKTPNEAFLYGIRAFVNERMGKDDVALADYRKAASLPNADVETLNAAARRLYNAGVKEYNADQTRKDAVKAEYWNVAKEIATRVLEMDPGNPSAESILESVEYVLGY